MRSKRPAPTRTRRRRSSASRCSLRLGNRVERGRSAEPHAKMRSRVRTGSQSGHATATGASQHYVGRLGDSRDSDQKATNRDVDRGIARGWCAYHARRRQRGELGRDSRYQGDRCGHGPIEPVQVCRSPPRRLRADQEVRTVRAIGCRRVARATLGLAVCCIVVVRRSVVMPVRGDGRVGLARFRASVKTLERTRHDSADEQERDEYSRRTNPHGSGDYYDVLTGRNESRPGSCHPRP